MSEIYNLSITAGETRIITVALTDAEGAAVSLTNALIHYRADLPTPILKTNLEGGGITLAEEDTVALIALTQADTIGIARKVSEPHECKVLLATGDLVVPFTGKLSVDKSLIGPLPPEEE